MAVGGKAKPVYIVSEEEITAGTFKVQPGPATRVYGVDAEELASSSRGVTGGNLQPVYIVDEGSRRIAGGEPILVTDAAMDNRDVTGQNAIPVYVMNLWPDPVEFISVTTAIELAGLCVTCLHPPNTQSNDLLVAEFAWDGGALGALGDITEPAGWTVVYEEYQAGQGWLQVAWKLVTTPQPADFEWCADSTGQMTLAISAYRCVDYLDPIDSVSPKKNGNDNKPNNNGTTTARDYTKLMMFVAAGGNPTLEPPPGWLKRADIGGASKSDKKNKGKGSTGGTGDATLSAPQVWQTVVISIAPCVGYPPTVTVRLSWDDNASNEDGYYVERSADGVNFVQVASIAANSITWDDEDVETGQTLWYRVRAYNGDGNSGYSNVASVGA